MQNPKEILNDLNIPVGSLFDSINYYNNSDLDKFTNEMSSEQALYCIIQACHAAYERKCFSMVESEVLSKALRKFTNANSEQKE